MRLNLNLLALRNQSRTLTAPNFPLAFSTVLSKGKLNITVRDHNGFPAFAITSDSRVVQVAATDRLKEILHEAQEEGKLPWHSSGLLYRKWR